ncbi:hypothetical protein [Carboxylicivirga linearis]|uniref:SRPBCC domain-containing protein n=1 Tax=Carboxylicivirga linearis TaxID=1628157 RepID=A0ABS5JSI6_9BACT|nr:hypothetical protein [Carboxylicivirga linearis]MBS2097834.1 hypothetical protein [Carboxylicivirga linearis]
MRHIFIISILLLILSCNQSKKEIESTSQHFQFEISAILKGSPVEIYDHLTGDISPWWDHTFSDKPLKLYIEAKPGGGFYEIFDESGDGIRHAVVTGAQRGKLLRMEGPLGLAGHALTLVTTYNLTMEQDSTLLEVQVHGSGEFEEEWPDLIKSVWRHFIIDRFKPYWEQNFNQ